MEWITNLVYKSTMATHLSIERQYRVVFAAAGAQIMLCSFCVLRRWEHDDLRAPYWRWYWNDTPGAFVRTGDKTVELGPDRVVLIPSETPFATETRAQVGHLYIHFATSARLSAQFRAPIVRHPEAEEMRMIRQLAALLRTDGEASRSDWPISFSAHALVAAALAGIPSAQWEMAADTQIARVLAVMHERLSMTLDNPTLARIASLSTNTLLRRFKQATGTTPHRYLCRLRVDNARAELLTSNDSIDAIARRNGFCDRFHLSRVFKQTLKVSPAAYRADGRTGVASVSL